MHEYAPEETFPRASGLLLHPTSLPGPHGVGDFGEGAFRLLNFALAAEPGHARSRYLMIRLLLAQGRTEQARPMMALLLKQHYASVSPARRFRPSLSVWVKSNICVW